MQQDIHAPTPGELPTKRQLNRATAIAVATAAALLVTVVLPAEFGIDPTGTGKLLGLTEMGQMKREAALAVTSGSEEGALTLDPEPALIYSQQSGEQTVTLAPGEGREVKAKMQAGAEFDYEWNAGGTPVHFELHGEPDGGKRGEYTSYEIGTSAGAKGKFRAPMAGTQGWYWRNDSAVPVTVNVKATGTWAEFVVVPKKP
jgi:hypothetical protein